MYDAIRKTVELTASLCQKHKIPGWRQKNHIIKKIKSSSTLIINVKKSNPRKKDKIEQKDNKLKKAYRKLIKRSQAYIEKAIISLDSLKKESEFEDYNSIERFINYGKKLIDQIERRVFKNEKISHDEKIFSIFEPHTEWICKGKAKSPFELGKRVSIVEDQYGFILNGTIMDRITDDKIAVPIIEKVKNDFKNVSVSSFDKGYYSRENKENLTNILDFVVLPKKGKLSKKDQELEESKEFKKYRKRHPAIESAINALEVHGLNRCLDKGILGFKRYVAMAIASRNVQIIGAMKLLQLRKKSHIAA